MAKGMLTRLDLPIEAFTKPTWWTSAVYESVPKRGLVFRGYTPNAWQTFSEHVDTVKIGTAGTTSHLVSWVWYAGQWVRAA